MVEKEVIKQILKPSIPAFCLYLSCYYCGSFQYVFNFFFVSLFFVLFCSLWLFFFSNLVSTIELLKHLHKSRNNFLLDFPLETKLIFSHFPGQELVDTLLLFCLDCASETPVCLCDALSIFGLRVTEGFTSSVEKFYFSPKSIFIGSLFFLFYLFFCFSLFLFEILFLFCFVESAFISLSFPCECLNPYQSSMAITSYVHVSGCDAHTRKSFPNVFDLWRYSSFTLIFIANVLLFFFFLHIPQCVYRISEF